MNGVPLRRVNQAYVIATSTKVDVSDMGEDLAKFDDAYFARTKSKSPPSKDSEEFFAEKAAVRRRVARTSGARRSSPVRAARRSPRWIPCV